MGTRIPDVRKRLLALAVLLDADEVDKPTAAKVIRQCEVDMYRRKPVRKGPVKARIKDPNLRPRMARYAAEHPDLLYREIGWMFGVDGGRVSEALAGFRK